VHLLAGLLVYENLNIPNVKSLARRFDALPERKVQWNSPQQSS